MTRAAAIQMVSGADVAANLAQAAELLAQATGEGARLAVLPENFAVMPSSDAERLAAAEDENNGPIQQFLAEQASRHGLWLVGGTVPLRARVAGKTRAACLVFDDRGARVARYDKIHLFDARLGNGEAYRESDGFEAGHEIVVLDTPAGRLGLAVCYDLRFPELFRRMLDAGAEIFAVPAAFTETTGRAHWELLLRARAVESLAYVVAADQGGAHDNGRRTWGESMIVSPWGEVLARRAQGKGVVAADLDRERLRAVREDLPSIDHRRL